MPELSFTAYSIVQEWKASNPGLDWKCILEDNLEYIARDCVEQGGLIGHIKALALFPGGEYLRISATSGSHPATSEGQIPPGSPAVTLTLNVLVYGLTETTVQDIVSHCTQSLAQKWICEVSFTNKHHEHQISKEIL